MTKLNLIVGKLKGIGSPIPLKYFYTVNFYNAILIKNAAIHKIIK